MRSARSPRLLAVSDLHVSYPENRRIFDSLAPRSDGDWLLVAGDVAERVADVEAALRVLRSRFSRVIWAPGNHELWNVPDDPLSIRGVARYDHLVELCRKIGVVTPEDVYPLWLGPGGPVRVVPLLLLYDYTYRPAGTTNKQEALAKAYESGVVCRDEYSLHPDPYPDIDSWCRARVVCTRARLDALAPTEHTVLLNHFPLVREPTRILRHQEFAQWCGTEATRDWHLRYRAVACVYGHLHVPRTTWHDGVRFEEVSIGYPREWRRQSERPWLRQVLPEPGPA